MIKQDNINAFIYEKHARYFKRSSAIAVPCYSYSHSPTAANATLGSLDFSVIGMAKVKLFDFYSAPG